MGAIDGTATDATVADSVMYTRLCVGAIDGTVTDTTVEVSVVYTCLQYSSVWVQ